jgi:ABC-2 type transport system ATP-binding protein
VSALDNVSLEIKGGEFFGLLGPNGAGKSTMMNLLAGYLDADGGHIEYSEEKIDRDSMEVRKKFGLVPQTIALYEELSAEANLKIFGSLYLIPQKELKEIIKEKLNMVELYERRKDLVKNFSGGMKRRLNMVASMLHNPEVLLCDEPTVGVDPQSRNAIFDFLQKINEEGMTVIYTTHYMEEAERLCKNIAIIDEGKIIAKGTVDELISLLPYCEEIYISKNADTSGKIDPLKTSVEITENADKYEIKLKKGILLSEFFKTIESSGINYNYIDFHKPTLEELFLNLTGRRLRD